MKKPEIFNHLNSYSEFKKYIDQHYIIDNTDPENPTITRKASSKANDDVSGYIAHVKRNLNKKKQLKQYKKKEYLDPFFCCVVSAFLMMIIIYEFFTVIRKLSELYYEK